MKNTSHIYPAPVKIFHVHRASLTSRLLQIDSYDEYGKITCDNCLENSNYAATSDRLTVYIHDGMTTGWRNVKEGYTGDKNHVDEVDMSDSTIPEITHGFLSMYEIISKYRPIDIMASKGNTDIRTGLPRYKQP